MSLPLLSRINCPNDSISSGELRQCDLSTNGYSIEVMFLQNGSDNYMANYFDKFNHEHCPPKVCPVIFLIDTSAIMAGPRIAAINKAMKSLLMDMEEYNIISGASYLKYALLTYSSCCEWRTEGLVDPDPTTYHNLIAEGKNNLVLALDALNCAFYRNGLFASKKDVYCTPLIFLILGEAPSQNYQSALQRLKRKAFFKDSKKVAFAIGDKNNIDTLIGVAFNINSVVSIKADSLIESIILSTCKNILMQELEEIGSYALAISYNRLGPFFPSDGGPSCGRNDNNFDSDRFCSTIALREVRNNADSDGDAVSKTTNHISEGIGPKKYYIKRASSENATDSNEIKPTGAEDHRIPMKYTQQTQVQIGNPACKSFRTCNVCGKTFASIFAYCPFCGMPTISEEDNVSITQVQFNAIVPQRLIKGDYAIVNIFVYEEAYRFVVDRIITNSDPEVKEVFGGTYNIQKNTIIRIVLYSPDIELSDCDETQRWSGKYLTFSFPIKIENDFSKKQILLIASVYFNGVIASKLKFIVNCSSLREQKLTLTREDVLTAFISYSSEDRSRVATIVQGMKKARPEMDVFFDVDCIISGEYWEKVLKSEIEKRDILFLCWSKNARNSIWVEKEWKYALACNGLDSIEPVPLISPKECPPPEELQSKHFFDRVLLYEEE